MCYPLTTWSLPHSNTVLVLQVLASTFSLDGLHSVCLHVCVWVCLGIYVRVNYWCSVNPICLVAGVLRSVCSVCVSVCVFMCVRHCQKGGRSSVAIKRQHSLQSCPHRYSCRHRGYRLSVPCIHAWPLECSRTWKTQSFSLSLLPPLLFSICWAVQFAFFFPSLLPLPPFLLSPSVSCALSTLFSLTHKLYSVPHLSCSSLLLCSMHKLLRVEWWYHPIVPVLSPAPKSMEAKEKKNKDERKREVDVGERWRRNEIRVRERDGNILIGMEGCFVFLHWGQLGNTNRCKDVFFRANRDGQALSTQILVWICIYLRYL